MMLEVGFAVREITPTLGSTISGGFSPRTSKGTLDSLQATVCVMRDAENTIVVIGVDAVSLSHATANRIRTTIAGTLCIPQRNIIVAASHTHCGGPSNDVLGSVSNAEYLDQLVARISEAAIAAQEHLQVAQCAQSWTHCDGLALNRRFKMRDGSEQTNPDRSNPDIIAPAGPTDPELGAIAFRTKEGVPLGAIASFACHPTLIWGDKFSGDFPSYWRSSMREKLHPEFTLVFLNGACGDVIPSDSQPEHDGAVARVRKMGSALADEMIRQMDSASYANVVNVATAHGVVRVKYRRPSSDALESARTLMAANGPWDREKWQARDLMLLSKQLGAARDVACSVDAMRIGNAIVAAAPWQPFCEFGLTIKKGSRYRPVLLATFANGMLGYVPTPAAFVGGGYEPTLCRGSKLTPDAGDAIVGEFLRVLKQL